MHNCIFCQIAKGKAKSWKVYETDAAYAFLDINPFNEYHTLVIPKAHYANIFDVPESELLQLISALKAVIDLYHEKLGIENMQIVSNSGAEAQQDIFHLHFHIIPRHRGDGQNVRRTPHPEMRERFDQLLTALH